MNDERKGLPSASGVARLAACPKSLQMCAGLPDASTPDSERGTRIHSAFAGEAITLDPDEQDILESLQRMEASAVEQWKATLPADNTETQAVMREWRMWLSDDAGKIFSGQPDVVYIMGIHGLILDGKTGRAEVAESTENAQLRALAVLLHEQYPGLETITVAILAPLVANN